ncbi:MAG TPA: hypothetical protein P5571_10895 [Candidatus Krumholzibacteria bacterium]|nr:hypothetical protein [Candidatus Krumholzibacteria bacterium]HRX51862.1 hypothetical protein [Candidatus Krumholzibacteria bacterium]
MKATKFTLTFALLLVAVTGTSFADAWFQEFRPVAGHDELWFISPGDAGETIAFQARVYDGYQSPVSPSLIMSASCTITFNNDQVACGGLTSLTLNAVDATPPGDGWWTFEIDHPMSMHVDADGDLDIIVGITFLVIDPLFGNFVTTDYQRYEAPVLCPDYNADLVVNLADVSLFSSAFYAQDANYDLNGDGVVNLADVSKLAAAIGDACGAKAAGMSADDVMAYIKTESGAEDASWSELKASYR